MNEFLYDERPLPQVLRQLASLSDEQFNILSRAVRGSEGFDDRYGRCKRLSADLGAGLNAHDVFKMLGSLWYLKSRLHDWRDAADIGSATDELFEFLGLDRQLGEDLDDQLKGRLVEILDHSPEQAVRDEVHRLRTGILDTVIDFDSFVDLRPRFSEDLSSVEEFIPVVVLGIAVEKDFGPEESYVFQLSPEGIESLRAVLEDVDDRLAALSAKPELGLRPHLLPNEGMD
jgi:hypothetical protein